MKNTLYERTLLRGEDAPDGETATQVVVTEEINRYFVWISSYHGTFPIAFCMFRNPTIEYAVKADRGELLARLVEPYTMEEISLD